MRRLSRPHKKDDNEADIVAALREVGCRVYDKLPLDLLVEYQGKWLLLEVKNPDGRNRKTTAQDKFLEVTRAPAGIANDPIGAIETIQDMAAR